LAARELNLKQRAFIAAFATGMGPKDAAIAAGYSAQSAKHTAHKLQRHPLVKAELETVRADIRKATLYDVGKAMGKLERGIAKAEALGQMQPYMKGMELAIRMAGLITDKQEVKLTQTVDLAGALVEAKARAARLMRDLPPSIEGEFCAVTSDAADGAIDTQSIPAAYPLHKFRQFG